MNTLEVVYAPSFMRLYAKLDKNLQQEVKEKILFFTDTKNHIHLKVHKLRGVKGIFSFSVNYKIRIVFEYIDNKKAALLSVGNHDEVY